MKVLKANLETDKYNVVIGSNNVSKLNSYIPTDKTLKKGSRRLGVIITDRKLLDQAQKVQKHLERNSWQVHIISVTANEALKSLESIEAIYNKLIKLKANRKTMLFALGGGTIGDTVGFVAATYMRGIKWVGLPTTLLAQVDSSIGGKTGINLPSGKNIVGAFHQPCLVYMDTLWLKSLPKRDLVSGIGEIVKYGLCFDRPFFRKLQLNWEKILNCKKAEIEEAIHCSVRWKLKIIKNDVYDRTGIREKLNLGHTFAHALETLTDYKKFRHGEAVAYGLLFAAFLSHEHGKLSYAELESIRHFIQGLPLPRIPKSITASQVFSAMKKDKKNFSDNIRYIFLNGIGDSCISEKVSKEDVKQALNYLWS